jgi:hypothetical protein
MSASDGDFDREFSDYSDQNFSDTNFSDTDYLSTGDRSENDYCQLAPTEENIVDDAIEVFEEEEKALLQNPKELKRLEATRLAAEKYEADLKKRREQQRQNKLEADRIALAEQRKLTAEFNKAHKNRVLLWNKHRSAPSKPTALLCLAPFPDISKLTPVMNLNIEMCKELHKAFDLLEARKQSKLLEARAVEIEKKRKREIWLKKQTTMRNKQTDDEYRVFAAKTLSTKERLARNKARKERKEKEKKAWEAKNKEAQANYVPNNNLIVQEFDFSDSKSESESDIPVSAAQQALIDKAKAAKKKILEKLVTHFEVKKKRLAKEKTLAAEKRAAEEKERLAEEKKRNEEKNEENYFVEKMEAMRLHRLTPVPAQKVKDLKTHTKSTKSKRFVAGKTITPGFTSLVEQARCKRKETDKRYAVRCDAFDALANKTKIDEHLKFTRLCKSVSGGKRKKCYHQNCRFAHKVEDLQKALCKFGKGCGFVKHKGHGYYKNAKFGRTGKKCCFYHPGENEKSFAKRFNLEAPKSAKPVTTTTQIKFSKTFTPASIPTKPQQTLWSSIIKKTEVKDKIATAQKKMTTSWSQLLTPPPLPTTMPDFTKLGLPKQRTKRVVAPSTLEFVMAEIAKINKRVIDRTLAKIRAELAVKSIEIKEKTKAARKAVRKAERASWTLVSRRRKQRNPRTPTFEMERKAERRRRRKANKKAHKKELKVNKTNVEELLRKAIEDGCTDLRVIVAPDTPTPMPSIHPTLEEEDEEDWTALLTQEENLESKLTPDENWKIPDGSCW